MNKTTVTRFTVRHWGKMIDGIVTGLDEKVEDGGRLEVEVDLEM